MREHDTNVIWPLYDVEQVLALNKQLLALYGGRWRQRDTLRLIIDPFYDPVDRAGAGAEQAAPRGDAHAGREGPRRGCAEGALIVYPHLIISYNPHTTLHIIRR